MIASWKDTFNGENPPQMAWKLWLIHAYCSITTFAKSSRRESSKEYKIEVGTSCFNTQACQFFMFMNFTCPAYFSFLPYHISPRYPPHIPHIHIHPKKHNLSRYLDSWNGCFRRFFWLDVLNVLLTKKHGSFVTSYVQPRLVFTGFHLDSWRFPQKGTETLAPRDDFKAISDPHAW